MIGCVDTQVTSHQQLAEQRTPCSSIECSAYAEGRQAVMTCVADAFVCTATQQVDQVIHPVALPGTQRSAECHARRLGAIAGAHGFQAVVAVAAVIGCILAEVVQQCLAATARDLAQPEHCVEALLLGAPMGVIGL